MPFVGFKIATIALKKKLKRGEQLQPYEPELHKPGVALISSAIEEDVEMQDENKTQQPLNPEEREPRLNELLSLLTYLESRAPTKLSFCQNGGRTVYAKFKETESAEREMHMVCTHFIASHLPQPQVSKLSGLTGPRSTLKKKEYEILIHEQEIPKDFFSSEITRA